MTWERFLSIALGVAFGNLLLAIHHRYFRWKDDPNRIKTASKDWRGRYVPDLKLRRAERLLLWAIIIFFVVGFVFSYYALTGYNPPALLGG